jgi:hypothetical protein
MPRRLALLLALALSAAAPAAAQTAPTCRNGTFAREQPGFALARVTPGAQTPFLWDHGGCPEAGARCQQEGQTAAPGQFLLIGVTHQGHRCAFLPGPGGGSAGFVRSDRLEEVPLAPPRPADWAGRWADGDNEVRIAAGPDGRLRAEGSACWPSCAPPPLGRPGGPNVGAFRAEAAPAGAAVAFADAECEVRATLLPPYLVVSDNGGCGGSNVSFSGVYRRR